VYCRKEEILSPPGRPSPSKKRVGGIEKRTLVSTTFREMGETLFGRSEMIKERNQPKKLDE